MYFDRISDRGGTQAPQQAVIPVRPKDQAAFLCRLCGDCCRHREDIVLSGYDLWRLARRLGLPPKVTARAFCRVYIGAVSGLPVLRLAPVKEENGNCPFLTGGRCAVHEARPLVCALYPLGQEIGRNGRARYYFQGTDCGGAERRASDQSRVLHPGRTCNL